MTFAWSVALTLGIAVVVLAALLKGAYLEHLKDQRRIDELESRLAIGQLLAMADSYVEMKASPEFRKMVKGNGGKLQ